LVTEPPLSGGAAGPWSPIFPPMGDARARGFVPGTGPKRALFQGGRPGEPWEEEKSPSHPAVLKPRSRGALPLKALRRSHAPALRPAARSLEFAPYQQPFTVWRYATLPGEAERKTPVPGQKLFPSDPIAAQMIEIRIFRYPDRDRFVSGPGKNYWWREAPVPIGACMASAGVRRRAGLHRITGEERRPASRLGFYPVWSPHLQIQPSA